jgi:subtilisin family serine protease
MPDPVAARDWITPDEVRSSASSGDGAGIKIAIIDSGIESDHPTLRELDVVDQLSITIRSNEAHIEEDTVGDVYGHGTAVAGLVHRVAPRAAVGSFRVLRPNGVPTEPAAIHAAVIEALKRGYQVINCSFGSPGTAEDVMIFKDWIDRAYLAGAHTVAACGNIDPLEREWPSHFATPISVGICSLAEGRIGYRAGQLVDFAAAGEGLRVPWKGGIEKTVLGSSFATPQVSGIVARILSTHPDLSPSLMKAALRLIASPVPN